jgi:probable F420-dependent oxidoreductase
MTMDFGLILPSYRAGASAASIDASSEAAARLGWHSVFTTDHLLVEPSKRSEDYFTLFDPLITLAHIAAKQPSLRIGISVVVVPMRNAVELAKELSTLDALSDGRLIVGAGVGWNEAEFGHLGYADRFRQRGAYLSEAVAIWRQLWSGNTGPFKGRFHSWDEIRFAPLPTQGADVPIWFGGRDEKALQRSGRLGEGYHSSSSGHDQIAVRVPIIRAAAEEAGRPMPVISARVRVQFGPNEAPFYMLAGTPEQMIAEIRSFQDVGASHLAFDFAETDPDECVRLMQRFDSEVLAAFR